MTVVLVASTRQLWIWNHGHWITPLGSLVLPLRQREQQGHPRKTSSDFSILEVHNLCRDDEVILHVLVRCNPQVFSNKSLRKITKFRPLQTSNMSIWNELWWGLWQNAPFVIHCLIQKVGHGFQSMLWCELKQSYSRASCLDDFWCFYFCKVQCNLWYMIHQLKLLLRASLVLHLQASKQPLFNWLWKIAATIGSNSVALQFCQAHSRCARAPLWMHSKGPVPSPQAGMSQLKSFPTTKSISVPTWDSRTFDARSAWFGLI